MSKYITVSLDGNVFTHFKGLHSYATICGLDGDDPVLGMETLPTPHGKKVDCPYCIELWEYMSKYTKRDIER